MVICKRCGKKVAIFNTLKIKRIPTNLCSNCLGLLKKYFEKRDKTNGKDIRLCSCCRRYKEIVYADGYPYEKKPNSFVFCYDCLERHSPDLLTPELKQKHKLKILQIIKSK